MVPDGWSRERLGDHVKIHSGFAPASLDLSDGGQVPYVKVDDLNNCSTIQTRSKAKAHHVGRTVPIDTVIFPKRGAAILNNKVRVTGVEMILDTNMMGLETKPSLDPWFAYYRLVFEQLFKIADTSTIPQINNKHINPYVFPLPPLNEQKKIAEILSTWDRAIEVAEAQLVCARTQKRALMQQLLTGRRRFPEFEGQEWKEVRFEDVFARVRRKNTVANDNVLTISAQHGLVSQETYFNKRVAAKDLSGYTLLEEGDFAYNKSYSAGYPLGAIKMLEVDEPGVVSSLYLCFALQNTGEHSREFFRHFFEAGCYNRQIYQIAQEGARNHGLLNVSATDFFRAYLRVPPLAEQRLIARTIGTAEVQEEVHRRELEKLRIEKKALMQQLLTGKRRVSV